MSFADEFNDADFIELPCEFCGELFPFQLLMEHQSGCRPDLLHYNFESIPQPTAPSAPLKSSSTIAATPPVVAPPKPSSISTKPPAPLVKPPFLTEKHATVEKKTKMDTTIPDPFEELFKSEDIPVVLEDNLQETEIKLMSYGSTVSKRTEEEKPSFRAPTLPLLNNADQKETEESCNSLSDSDEGECLEDFWRRAEIKNAQRLRKLKV